MARADVRVALVLMASDKQGGFSIDPIFILKPMGLHIADFVLHNAGCVQRGGVPSLPLSS